MSPPPIHFVSARSARFAYFTAGEGPLVLLFHGFPDTAHTWLDLLPRLAEAGFRAVAPFLRGYAPTEQTTSDDVDAATLAHDAVALVDALGAERATLVGHDWGAAAVYGAASIAPAKIEKLVAVAIPHPATLMPALSKLWAARHFAAYKLPGAAARFAANDFAALRAIYARWSPRWQPTDDDLAPVRACFADRASLDAAFGYYRALSFRAPPHLRQRITVPTVVFGGDSDPQVTRSDFERAARMFEGSYAIEELRGGHFVHREDPDAFASRLLAHLRA